MAKSLKKRTFTMKLHDEKKHSVLYKAGDGEKDPPLDSAYFMKTSFNGDGDYPETIKVTVEPSK